MDRFISCLSYVAHPLTAPWRVDAEDLEEVLQLRKATLQLRCAKDDLLRSLEIREAQGFRRTSEVESWLRNVDDLVEQVADFLASSEDRTSCVCLPDVLFTGHQQLRKAAGKHIEDVRVLMNVMSELTEFSVESEPPALVGKGLQIPSSVMVGMEETLAEIRRSLRHNADSTAGIVGVCGMGGGGKTALLRSIYNSFVTSGEEFELVVWVTVSRGCTTERLQWDIAGQLGLRLPDDPDEYRSLLFNALSRKRFLIILDDVWEKVDFLEIGIPLPPNRSRIVLTSRLISVCHSMGADKIIKVPLLSDKAAWELFRRVVGAEMDLENGEIQHYAEQLVSLCNGLPLALITVGRAMSNQGPQVFAWKRAVKAMRSSGGQIRGFSGVLDALKFSFDSLASEVMKACLVYCCLFPAGLGIDREQLVDYWLAEGFLDGEDDGGCLDLDLARNRGHRLVDQLVEASLLECGGFDMGEGKVSLHDLVLDMLIGVQQGLVLTHALSGLTQFPKVARWSEIRRVSLMMNEIQELHPIPPCPHLRTLFLDHNIRISKLPEGFLMEMPALRVLNLSHTSVCELPAEIGLLVELRYLNLSYTPLRSLPREVGNLVKLKHLDLTRVNIDGDLRVSNRVISGLSSLQVLSIPDCKIEAGNGISGRSIDDNEEDRQITLSDLESLKELQDLWLTIATDSALEKFLGSRSLLRRTRVLSLEGVSWESIRVTADEVRLRCLGLVICLQLEELLLHPGSQEVLILYHLPKLGAIRWASRLEPRRDVLRRLLVHKCSRLLNVSWVLQFENLEEICVTGCTGFEQVIGDDHDCEVAELQPQRALCRLRILQLTNLPSLRSICPQVLDFPSLECLSVAGCPSLGRLPFGRRSAPKLREILADGYWWDSLEWDEHHVESVFAPKLRTH